MTKREEYRRVVGNDATRGEPRTAAAITEVRGGWDAYEVWRARIRDEREKVRVAAQR